MKINPTHRCVFQPNLTKEEVEGFNWMGRVLNNIRKAGPTHKNYHKAAAAARALAELAQFCARAEQAGHSLMQTLELALESPEVVERDGFSFAEYKMTTQEKGQA